MSARHAAGFTLLEMALALFITMAVLASMVTFYAQARQAQSLTQDASLIIRSIQNVRAAYQGQEYVLNFVMNYAVYSPQVPQEIRGPTGSYQHQLPGGPILMVLPSSREEFRVTIFGEKLRNNSEACVAYVQAIAPYATRMSIYGTQVKATMSATVSLETVQTRCRAYVTGQSIVAFLA